MATKLADAHAAVLEMAAKLEKDGFTVGDIVDALIIRGINAGVRITDGEHMVKFLEQMIVQIRSGATLGTTRH
jgi:hypothetical protein